MKAGTEMHTLHPAEITGFFFEVSPFSDEKSVSWSLLYFVALFVHFVLFCFLCFAKLIVLK